jgi:hypothetical protein
MGLLQQGVGNGARGVEVKHSPSSKQNAPSGAFFYSVNKDSMFLNTKKQEVTNIRDDFFCIRVLCK